MPHPATPTLLAAILAAAMLGAGCRSLPEFDWNPLIRVEHTSDGAVEIEALGPFIAIRDGPEGLSHAFRPLYQRKANFGRPVTDFLAPFGRHWHTETGTRWRFWPLIWTGETTAAEDGERWQAVFFPIIFAGNGPRDDDGYFAIWPLGGRTRGLFGIDTWDFFLWPFFMRTHMEVVEQSDSWTVLLLIGWTTGGPRDGSWRFLPFYRRRIVRTAEGAVRTDLHTVLWPFFTFGKDHADGDDPGTRHAFWPLYGYEAGENWRRLTILWPFFRFNRDTNPPPSEGGSFLYDAPWPFFRWQSGGRLDKLRYRATPQREVFRIWPFYSHQRTENVDSTSWLWPIGWHRKTQGRTTEGGLWPAQPYQRVDNYVLPFWHGSRREVTGREGLDRERQFWPLFHWDSGADGRRDAGFPSLVPARNIEFLRPVDELFSPFFTLWRSRSDGVRDETRLLFDLFLWRTGPEGVRVSIPFLYSLRPEAGGVQAHRVLWGLGGWRTGPEGLSSVSLVGFDLWRR